MELIDRIRSQASNPAAVATDDDPVVAEYDGNAEVEGLGTITDLRDHYDLGPVGNEEDPNAPALRVVLDLRDDPNYDLGPAPETDEVVAEVDEDEEDEDENDSENEEEEEVDPEARKNELLAMTRDELTELAGTLEIEDAASMPNKDAIADAIIVAESEDDDS